MSPALQTVPFEPPGKLPLLKALLYFQQICREMHEDTNVLERLRGISKVQVSKVQSQVSDPSHTVPLYHGCIFSEARLVGISSILCSLATVNITG